MFRDKATRRTLFASALLLAAWLLFAYLIAPNLIRAAYRGESLAWINAIISGQAEHPLSEYLQDWSRLALVLTAWIVAGGILAGLAVRFRHRLSALWRQLRASGDWGPISWFDVALVGAFFGLLTGAGEAIHTVLRLGDRPNWDTYSREVIWMAPLADAIAFAVLGLAVAILGLAFRRINTIRAVTAFFVGFSVFVLLRSMELGLHWMAVAVLAAGVAAVVVRRFTAVAPRKFSSFVRRSTAALLASSLAIGAGLQLHESWRERQTLERLPDPAPGAPNVLLLVLDTVRAMSLSLYGYDRATTPNLDRLASRAVVFDRAVATAPWTLPSHVSLFTGQYHHETVADWDSPLPEDAATLTGVLSAKGYAAGAFVANVFYCSTTSGLEQGFARYEDHPISLGMVFNNAWLTQKIAYRLRWRVGIWGHMGRKSAEDVNRRFLEWQSDTDGRPFFAFLNYLDAHEPYWSPPPYRTRFYSREPRYWTGSRRTYSASVLEQLTAAYDGTLAYLDAQISALLEELERRGVLENTIVVITSDHGEQFGERDPALVLHGNSLYWPLLHVPLLILPHGESGVRGGVRVTAPVSIRDVPATILDLAGHGHQDSGILGRSLRPLWRDRTVGSEYESAGVLSAVTQNPFAWFPPSDPVSRGAMRSILADTHHYIVNDDGSEELFDVTTDPWEVTDLSDSAIYAARLDELRRALSPEKIAISRHK